MNETTRDLGGPPQRAAKNRSTAYITITGTKPESEYYCFTCAAFFN